MATSQREGFFFPFKLAHPLNMLIQYMYNPLKRSSLVGLKYKGDNERVLRHYRYVCRIVL